MPPARPEPDFGAALRRLVDHRVDFIVVGGFAAAAHGSARITYDLDQTVTVRAFGVDCRCLGLAKLIEVKRAAGRPKDLEAIAELEALLEEAEGADPA